VQWREGHCYAYSQNIPYFPLIDLLSRAWQITRRETIRSRSRKKVETGAGHLIGERNDLIPYLGSLYSLKYPEIENVSPEYWKARLHEASSSSHEPLQKDTRNHLHGGSPLGRSFFCRAPEKHPADFRYPAIFLCASTVHPSASLPAIRPPPSSHTMRSDFRIYHPPMPRHGGIAPQDGFMFHHELKRFIQTRWKVIPSIWRR
jgi:hypothetical protein